MSTARGFGLNGKSYYINIGKPMEVACNFIVDNTNGNGLGIRSLKSNGYIENVFMHTTATPGSNNGHLNPNPAAGYIFVNFKNNFNYYLGGFNGQIIAPGNTSTTSLTAGNVYTITSLGTTTLAQWQTAGYPVGFTPALNGTFIAAVTASLGGTGTVGTPGVPGVELITAIGDPNQTIANTNIAQNAGAQLVLACWAPTSSSVTTLAATAPANNTVISLDFMFDGSTVSIPDSSGSTGL